MPMSDRSPSIVLPAGNDQETTTSAGGSGQRGARPAPKLFLLV